MRAGLVKLVSTSLAACALLCAAPSAAAPIDDAVLAEVNFARTRPQDYARRLMLQPVSNWERALMAGGAEADPEAFAEAIDFLMRQTPLPPLRADDRLAASALAHVAEQGPVGAVGHDSENGEAFDERIRRHGVEAESSAENIAYGPRDAADVVRELIIDSGVPDRGHRRNIFHAEFESAGVTCGSHRDYAAMCVMDFAGAPLRSEGWRQAELSATSRGGGGFLTRFLHWR